MKTRTNYSGGIQGGISNGMPIVFETVVKPTASIFKKQETIDLLRMENTTFELQAATTRRFFTGQDLWWTL